MEMDAVRGAAARSSNCARSSNGVHLHLRRHRGQARRRRLPDPLRPRRPRDRQQVRNRGDMPKQLLFSAEARRSLEAGVDKLAKEVATKTNDVAGDGTTTATVLAQALVHEGLRNVAAGANPMGLKRGME